MDSIRKYEENQEYYETLDKRTKQYKAYKQWKENREAAPKGMGDTLEKVFEATGVADVVKFIAGEDCGCDERKAKLNKILPFHNPECFTEEEYNWISEFFERGSSVIDRTKQKKLVDIYNRVFRKKQRLTTCSSCIRQVYNDLKRYFDSYNS
jgi:hypothetical protein